MKNMFDWNSFECCCSSNSLSISVFHVQWSSVVACLNYGYGTYKSCVWMRLCDCVAPYTQHRILSIWLNAVSTMHLLRTHNTNSEWWKKLLNLFPCTQYSRRFTAAEQVLGIVITIHSPLLLLPLLLFCYCYFSTSTYTHTHAALLSILNSRLHRKTLLNGLSCSRSYNSIPIQA